MAAGKRITQSMVNWDTIAERVPTTFYVAFRSDVYARKMLSLSDEPLKIDWALYKSKGVQPEKKNAKTGEQKKKTVDAVHSVKNIS
jgi:hypothetical protein